MVTQGTDRASGPVWLDELKRFERPSVASAGGQLANTMLPYVALWALMIAWTRSGLPYWLMTPLLVAAALFLVRIFIFFHDCCHGSFVPTPWGNRVVGFLTGVLTFTTFSEFRYTHGVHHSTAGNLDRRGVGGIWTMTVQEYGASTRLRRLNYRLYRHPVVLFLLGPVFWFLISNRIPRSGSSLARKLNVMATDLGIAVLAAAIGLAWGWRTYLLIQLPVLLMTGAMGIWLFYVQHQFDPSSWQRDGTWSFVEAALSGSSYYRLPRPLQWLSGNIGLHHVHHLRPRIPNYRLQACLDSIPALRLHSPLTLRRSFASIRLKLWDEAGRMLVPFRGA